jgi:peptidyl-prolyl cis-trans isomerase A (cyclophilin A)
MSPFSFSRRAIMPGAFLVFIAVAAMAQTGSQPQAQSRPQSPAASRPAQTQPDDDSAALVYVLAATSKGDFVLELNREKAPITVANFVSYVDKNFYDGTIFHRIVTRGIQVIQGGGFTADMTQKPTDAEIRNEWGNGLLNQRGTISMARRPPPDSATSQFFINVQDNPSLDGPGGSIGYAVFGRVVAGMKVVEDIQSVPIGPKRVAIPEAPGGFVNFQGVPVEPVIITSVKRLTPAEARKHIEGDKPAETKPAASQPATTRPRP